MAGGCKFVSKYVTVYTRLKPELYAEVEAVAEKDERSTAGEIAVLLREALDARKSHFTVKIRNWDFQSIEPDDPSSGDVAFTFEEAES